MLYNKFVFLYTSNFCTRINDFYNLEDWVANGYDVEYWDLSAITCHEHLSDLHVEGLTTRTITTLREFRNLVKENRSNNVLYLTWVNYCWYSAGFYSVLSQYNCDYAFFDNGLLPSFSYQSKNRKRRVTLRKIYHFLRDKYYRYSIKTPLLKPATFYFQLSDSYKGHDKIDSNTIHGWCNAGDYERNRKLQKAVEGKYIVFLDQYLPYHNDITLNGQKHIDADLYYSSINNAFSLIETQFGVPVVIAAHPAANRYNEINPFEGRRILFNKTAELVKGAELVLAHYTTAISYVVLNRKRMILFTSDAIRNFSPYIDSYIQQLANLLSLNCINLDSLTKEQLFLSEIPDSEYEDYKYKYLTNEHSKSISNFDSIISTLNQKTI